MKYPYNESIIVDPVITSGRPDVEGTWPRKVFLPS
jgi:hypothetical protein